MSWFTKRAEAKSPVLKTEAGDVIKLGRKDAVMILRDTGLSDIILPRPTSLNEEVPDNVVWVAALGKLLSSNDPRSYEICHDIQEWFEEVVTRELGPGHSHEGNA